MALPNSELDKISTTDIIKNSHILFQMDQQKFEEYSKTIGSVSKQLEMVKKIYYSEKNIDYISKKLIFTVYKITNGEYIIEKQHHADIILVMENVWKENIKNCNNDITKIIPFLDNLVINKILPDIIGHVKSYIKYIQDSSGMNVILDHPKYVSKKGDNILPAYDNNMF